MFKFKTAKPIPIMPKPIEPTANIQHDKATALVSNALGMFHTAIAQINKANEFLNDAVNMRKEEINSLNRQLLEVENHCESMSAEVNRNNVLKEKLKQFVE